MEKYVLSIFDGGEEPYQVDLEKFNKENISFGRSKDNDLVLHSILVSRLHGCFQLSRAGVRVKDAGSTNGLVHNGIATRECLLAEGDILRIDKAQEGMNKGVLILLNAGEAGSSWKQFQYKPQGRTTIGRAADCDITLPHVSVSKHHLCITRKNSRVYVEDLHSTNGTFLNDQRVIGVQQLQDKDVLLVADTKLIVTEQGIFYCSSKKGIGLEASHLVKVVKGHKKEITICNDVSLAIPPGAMVAMVGGSGAGKTTLMNMISGYSRPSSGKVFINGVNLYHTYDAVKNIIGYVPQQDIVYDNLTLWDMLIYSAKLRLPDDTALDEMRKRVSQVIGMVELAGKEHTMIRQLSGGQKKRASIAVELLSDPKLLFLDEPTSGLDPGTEHSLMTTLKRMASEGKTIVLVTHSTLNLHICDKIVFMGQGGNLCFYGSVKEAVGFFHVDSIVKIYDMLTDHAPEWRRAFMESAYSTTAENGKDAGSGKIEKETSRHGSLRQIRVLTERYIKLLINDRKRMLLLVLQAPALALLISLVEDGTQFDHFGMTKSLLFALSCSAFWIGILNSIQEVCKERNILRREYMTGLKLGPYISSKILVLGLMCLIQTALLTAVFVWTVGGPEEGVLLPAWIELYLTAFLTSVSAAAMGIFVSTLVKNQDRAMTIAPLLLMPQILFSGLLFELTGVTKTISWFAICRWSMEGFGTTANLNGLKYMVKIDGKSQEVAHKAEKFFEYTSGHIGKDWMILTAFIVGFVLLSVIVLRNIKKNN